jgi:trk system potassium uptake protein
MNFTLISRLIGILISLFSFTMLVPAIISYCYNDGQFKPFFYSFLCTFFIGLITSLLTDNKDKELSHKDGFLITALFWLVLGIFGSLPFLLSETLDISITDALFESLSGLSTTGATVITGLDTLPKSLLYYRQQLQWLGGIGIIVIAVAILPILGIGGMQLYRAEIPGPNKDEKLAPRITQTAKWIFFIYLGLTLACAVAYKLGGMSYFDAITHSFSTVAIGGFSTHDSSMGFYSDNHLILYIASTFMLLSAINFTLHYYAILQLHFKAYTDDTEFRFFIILMIFCVVVSIIGLSTFNVFDNFSDRIAHGSFQVISILTTTGFSSTDFSAWPSFLPIWLLLLACIGGCAGSTAGGAKVIRVMIIFKQGMRELFLLVHPNAVAPIKLRNRRVPNRIVSAIWSFIAIYIYVFISIFITLMVTGLDLTTALSSTIASLNNLGPGLGEVKDNYQSINDPAKWILCLAMLLGRLEIFTLLVILTPEFWKK